MSFNFSLADQVTSTQVKLEDIRNHIKSIQKKISRDEKILKKETTNLQKIEQQINQIQAEKSTLQTRIKDAKTQQIQLNLQIKQERLRIEDELENMREVVMSQHRMGQNNYLKLLLSQHDPIQVERTMVYYRYLSQLISKRVVNTRLQLIDLIDLESESMQVKSHLTELLSALKQKAIQIRLSQKKRLKMITTLDNKLAKSTNKINRLKEDENRINKLIQALQLAAKEQTQFKQKTKKNTSQNHKEKNQTHTQPILERISSNGLGRFKGKLRLPVKGIIKAKYGSTKIGSGVRWNGIMLKVKSGQPVRAIHDGHVVYADWFKGFGQLLIIDHGQGYMSLYSHNSKLNKALGDKVKANEVIAATGSTGGLNQPGLYFEVRYNGEPRDPLIWCKL